MRFLSARTLVLGTIAATLVGGPALADRDPTPEERNQIETQLQTLGYESWEEIEWDDDGYWEIDDAVHEDGQEYELHLAPDTLEVVKKEDD